MGTPTQYYVDPAINANTGSGTIGDPYGDLQHALNTVTRDATNGDQFNVKAGTSEVLSSALSFTTYGTPTATAPCIIRGYTSAANDGGIGVVSGGGSVACINNSSLGHIKLIDMRFTDCDSNAVITLGNPTLILNCEVDTSTGVGISITAGSVIGCFIHNIGGNGVMAGGNIMFNTFRNETNSFSSAVQAQASGSNVSFNLFDLSGPSHGITFNASSIAVLFNSIFSNGGTGTGIRNHNTSNTQSVIINNTVEGFSGAGGNGIVVAAQNADIVGYNMLYNNTTNMNVSGDSNADLGNNDVLGSSPFTNATSDDFDPIAGLLASYPSFPTSWNNYASTQQNLIRMAAQYAAGGGSGGAGPLIGGRLKR
jgi:hypothetical protein